MPPGTTRESSRWEIPGVFVFGVVFLATMLVVAIRFPAPTEFQILVFRVVLAMSAAGVGAIVPGFITVNIPNYIRAGGALALFIVVFKLNPPTLVSAVPPSGPTMPSQPPAASPPQSKAVLPEKPSEVLRKPSEQAVPATSSKKIKRQLAQVSPSPSASTAQGAPGPEDKALLQELRERMTLLSGRAAAVRGSVENLERQQSRAGLSLRTDVAAAKESVEHLMGEAKASLAAGETAATKRNLDLAEQQVEKLERFLGR